LELSLGESNPIASQTVISLCYSLVALTRRCRYLNYSWIFFVCVLTQQMLKEKEAKIKEIMFIMGFSPRLFWLG